MKRTITLRAVLYADALVCFLFGITFVLAAEYLVLLSIRNVAAIMGFEPASAFRVLGLLVLTIGAGVAAVARMPRIRVAAVIPILAIEVVWIAACGAILLSAAEQLTATGFFILLMSALAVGAFLVLELLGVRALAGSS